MWRLPALFLVVAVATALAARIAERLGIRRTLSARPLPSRHVKVLLSSPVDAAWKECIVHFVTQARHPRNLRFVVLLECTRPSDAEMGELDSELRPIAKVVHAKAKHSRNAAERMRRMVRRFVDGDESLVVVVDHRIRVLAGWDAYLDAASEDGVVLSAPAASRQGVAAFPTRKREEGGKVRRGPSRRFEGPASLQCVPSVCWCEEFTCATPSTLRAWPRCATSSAVAHTEASRARHVVPCVPLVEESADVEGDALLHDQGCDSAACGKHERVGLSRRAGDAEKIVKFGTSRAARLAVEFG